MNKVILIGRLTRDPEVRVLSPGTAVANFSLAINRNYYRKHFLMLSIVKYILERKKYYGKKYNFKKWVKRV